MTITFQEVIALLPLLFLCMTILFVLLCIILCRDCFLTCCMTVLGLSLSLLSLYFVSCNGSQKVAQLIYIDSFSVLCMILILFTAVLISLMTYMWSLRFSCIKNFDEFYLLLLIMTLGGITLVNASHLVSLFFGIELMSLPLSGLIGYTYFQKHSLEATMKYVILSGVASSFLLFGIALLYFEMAQLSFVDISYKLSNMRTCDQSVILLISVSMMLIGLCFKLSLVPCHLWTSDVYQGASEIATICLATISKIAIFSVLARFILLFPLSCTTIYFTLSCISYISILFGSLMAIVHKSHIKRFLAYSSIAHMGYLLVCVLSSIKQFSSNYVINFLSLGHDSMEVISIYLVSYLFATLGVFSVVNVMSNFCSKIRADSSSIAVYCGLFWHNPVLAIAFTIILLSLSGIPMTLGFIAKAFLIMSIVEQKLWGGIIVIIFSSVLSIIYYLRVITSLYLSSSKELYYRGTFIQHFSNCDSHWIITPSGIIVLLCSILLLFFGIFPQCFINFLCLLQEKF